MANIDNVQLPDGSSYNLVDNTSGFATQNYVNSAVDSITKTTIGLGNVDNTSDLDKPVSTAQQNALDAKVNKSGDTMSGVLTIDQADGTTSSVGTSRLNIGNTTPSGTEGNSSGFAFFYGNSGKYARLDAMNVTANRNIALPDKSDTLASMSDIPKIARGRASFTNSGQSVSLNYAGAGFTEAPTVMVVIEGSKSYARAEIGDSPLYVSNVTATRCTIEVNRIANNNAIAFYYLAVGK